MDIAERIEEAARELVRVAAALRRLTEIEAMRRLAGGRIRRDRVGRGWVQVVNVANYVDILATRTT